MNENEYALVAELLQIATLRESSDDDPRRCRDHVDGLVRPRLGERPCPYDWHRGAEWYADGDRLCCGICHPPASPEAVWAFGGPRAAGLLCPCLFDAGAVYAPPHPFPLMWWWKEKLPERRGTRCRVIAQGRMGSVQIEFEDGARVIASHHAVRKYAPLNDERPPPYRPYRHGRRAAHVEGQLAF